MTRQESFHFIFSVIFGLIWIINGFILNIIQSICYVLVRPFSKSAFRKINYYLTYSSWSQIIAISEYWCSCEISVYYADEESKKNFGKEHCLTVMNHRYEIDWLYCWIICDKLRTLGSAKTFAKKSLRWIPVIGWGWVFCEMIFLARDWDKDSLVLGQKLDRLMEYTDKVTLLLFSEGTRFTQEKYEASVKFALSKGLKPLKYHLQPRTRGFVYTLQRLKDKIPSIFNIQLAFPNDSFSPTLINLLKGKPIHGHLYVERIPLENIPVNDEEKLVAFLHNLYHKKDELMEYFNENNSFPGLIVRHRRRKSPFIHWILWSLAISSGFLYFTTYLFRTKNYLILSIIAIFILIGLLSLALLVRSTKAKKGSKYGISDKRTNGETKTETENSNDSGDFDLRKRVTLNNY